MKNLNSEKGGTNGNIWGANVKVATVRAVKLMWADYPGIPDISEIHFSDSTKLPTLKTSCSQICAFMRKRGEKGAQIVVQCIDY